MNNPFDFFDKIFYINLDDRKDRNEKIINELSKYEIKYERFSAVRLTDEESELMTQKGFPLCERVSDDDPYHRDRIKKVTLGQRSCLMSHLKLYKYAKENNLENILIFEDDSIFNDDVDVVDILNKSLKELQEKEWDMFFLGCLPLSKLKKSGDYLYEVFHLATSHSYVVNKRCYDLLLDFPFDKEMNIDMQFSNLSGIENKIKIYTPKYPLTFQGEDFSDIQQLKVGDIKKYITERYKQWTE